MTFLSSTTKSYLRTSFISISVLGLVGLSGPASVLAQEVPPETTSTETTTPAETTTPPEEQNNTGPQKPPGEDSYTFIYNEQTGLWENDYYTWDPVTKQTKPKQALDYSYNPETGLWDTTSWRYDPAAGKYVENIVTVSTPPAGAVITDTPQDQQALLAESKAAEDGYGGAGGGGDAEFNNEVDVDGIFDLFYNSHISNSLNSDAQSGDATVAGNTIGGNATSGDASAAANLINTIWSYWDNLGSSLLTFAADVVGSVFGDVVFDPGALINGDINANNEVDVDINAAVDNNALIENDIVLNAGTGNATVSSNTYGGDATSGDAVALVNIINMINSAIGSGQSFLGMINIHGDFNGDILLPPGLLDTILAANGPNSTFNSSNIVNAEILAEFDNNQTIENDINLSAESGNATVSGNTTGGNATTGDATTNLTLLNLTGREVIGSNCFLVFVNVLGTWVGMIMDAPGSTAAAIGGDITQNNQLDASLNLDVDNTSTIDNDITLTATSGDATVSNNTIAGDATTGNATASANILNMINSQFSLTDWFGVLFINVFGNWMGSFGVDTAAGNHAATPQTASAKAKKNIKVYALGNDGGTSYTATPLTEDTPEEQLASTDEENGHPVGAAGFIETDGTTPAAKAMVAAANASQPVKLVVTTALLGFALLGTERMLAAIRNKKTQPASAQTLKTSP